MITKFAVSLALIGISTSLSAGAFKCQMPDGTVNYQQTPCESAETSQVIDIQSAPSQSDSAPPDDPYSVMNQARQLELKEAKERLERARRAAAQPADTGPTDLEIRNARVGNRVIRGMSKDDVRRSWGAPSSTYQGSGGYESWSYRHYSPGGSYSSQTVIFDYGKVTDVKNYSSRYTQLMPVFRRFH